MHGIHIINPHRRHANRALTLKCIVRIWTSGGLSVDCSGFEEKRCQSQSFKFYMKACMHACIYLRVLMFDFSVDWSKNVNFIFIS